MQGFNSRASAAFRLLLVVLAAIPLIFFQDFFQHFYAHFSGSIINYVIEQQWLLVLLNILVFVSFLIPLSFRRKAKWQEYGIVTAFFVSLFIEMYGIPLTVVFASNFLYDPVVGLPPTLLVVELLGVDLSFDIAMLYGSALMILGTILIVVGWVTLYTSSKKGVLVTGGIYSVSRHPQYAGFIMVLLGWFFGWPTILTTLFVPILVYKYVKLCSTEEKEVMQEFPGYAEYAKKVPFIV